MIDELNAAIGAYEIRWHSLVAERKDDTQAFFAALKAVAVGWKTQDPAEFDRRFTALRAFSDQVHLGWVNKRWLATFHLRDQKLAWGIETVKLMQARPGSADRAGLDHLDFLTQDARGLAELKIHEPNLKITEERNGDHCSWTSVWFDGTEAKIRTNTVYDTCAAELLDAKSRALGVPGTVPASGAAQAEAKPHLPPAQAIVAAAATQLQEQVPAAPPVPRNEPGDMDITPLD